ncbi:hypothetical protein H072_1563 [Dactylellina haptotyla CBS 200.50]|uniref:Uncharacterized protein n=1 Tax=Dactylellina haptotyla (strain CBS 200.50) TaxID=1284197 RepID=S8AND5_DACHA|nr:hypothetical protein H072_1563 [Dactylellina haptotyla CBS 200.50]
MKTGTIFITSLLSASVYAQTSTTTSAVAPMATGCPATYNTSCPFYCGGSSGACSLGYYPSTGHVACRVCDGYPQTCPAAPDASCAFICSSSIVSNKFCYKSDLSQDLGQYEKISCTPCGGATNSTTGLPMPTFSSGASAVSVGGAAFFGLIYAMLA